MKSLQEMLVFVAENSEVYRQQYIKLYDYIEEFIQCHSIIEFTEKQILIQNFILFYVGISE